MLGCSMTTSSLHDRQREILPSMAESIERATPAQLEEPWDTLVETQVGIANRRSRR